MPHKCILLGWSVCKIYNNRVRELQSTIIDPQLARYMLEPFPYLASRRLSLRLKTVSQVPFVPQQASNQGYSTNICTVDLKMFIPNFYVTTSTSHHHTNLRIYTPQSMCCSTNYTHVYYNTTDLRWLLLLKAIQTWNSIMVMNAMHPTGAEIHCVLSRQISYETSKCCNRSQPVHLRTSA